MSKYLMPSLDPRYGIEAGFDAESRTFWYHVWHDMELVSFAGPGLEMITLIDLVRRTWGYIDWPAATKVARMLRDDAAWVSQASAGDPSTYYLARTLAENPDLNVDLFWASQEGAGTHVNISGAGVVEGSDNAEDAQRLIEWLATDGQNPFVDGSDCGKLRWWGG